MANTYRTAGAAVLAAGFGAAVATAVFTGSSDPVRGRDFDWPRAAEEAVQRPAPRDFDWPESSALRRSDARDFDWPAADPRDPRMAEAEDLMKAEEWSEAAKLLERVVADSPDDADAYSYLGYCDRMRGDRDRALARFGRALAIHPAHRGALGYLGRLYLDMNDLPKAKEQLDVLSRLCGGSCGEYRGLQEEVQRFKASQRRG